MYQSPGRSSNWGICNTCGGKVFWTDRADQDRRIPLSPTGETGWFLDEHDSAHATHIWERHLCKDEDIKVWEANAPARIAEAKARREFREGRQASWQLKINAYHEELWKVAMTVYCPKCKAEVGEKCINLATQKRTGERVPIKSPHSERTQSLPLPVYPGAVEKHG